jgi:hypothetical protein
LILPVNPASFFFKILGGFSSPRRIVSCQAEPSLERSSIMRFSSWSTKWHRIAPRGRRQISRRRRLASPPVAAAESLERRVLLSAFTAATAADLVSAINAANKAGGSNTITLTAPTTSPYALTAANNTTHGATGTPVISGATSSIPADNLTIVGNGDTIERSTASGTPAFRLFDVASGGSLTLQNMTLQNGFAYGAGTAAQGGAIRNAGTLTLDQVSVDSNEALGVFIPSSVLGKNKKQVSLPGSSGDAAGGGVWSSGSLTIEDQCVIQNNTAIGAATGSGYGGGICVAGGTANVSSATVGALPVGGFPGNTALGGYNATNGTYAAFGPGAGYGGGVYVGSGTATLTNDFIRFNSAGSYINGAFVGFNDLGYGGGIYIATGATVDLDAYTLYSTTGNTGQYPAATSDIYGSYTLL